MLARKYSEETLKSAAAAAGSIKAVRKAAELIAKTASEGRRVYVSDRFGIVESEIADKPGNLALFRPLSTSGYKPGQGDVLVLSTYFPNDPPDVEQLDAARSNGAHVIAIGPEGGISEKADVAVPDGGARENGVLSTQGSDRAFGPVSGIVHVLLMNMIQAETAAALVASGKKPAVLPAGYASGGRERLIEALREFSSRGL